MLNSVIESYSYIIFIQNITPDLYKLPILVPALFGGTFSCSAPSVSMTGVRCISSVTYKAVYIFCTSLYVYPHLTMNRTNPSHQRCCAGTYPSCQRCCAATLRVRQDERSATASQSGRTKGSYPTGQVRRKES